MKKKSVIAAAFALVVSLASIAYSQYYIDPNAMMYMNQDQMMQYLQKNVMEPMVKKLNFTFWKVTHAKSSDVTDAGDLWIPIPNGQSWQISTETFTGQFIVSLGPKSSMEYQVTQNCNIPPYLGCYILSPLGHIAVIDTVEVTFAAIKKSELRIYWKLFMEDGKWHAYLTDSVLVDRSKMRFPPTRQPQSGVGLNGVKIGKHVWTTQNMNIAPRRGYSWCYNNDTVNCRKYGRMYDLEGAMFLCPEGWHLPSDAEWEDLNKTAGSVKKLKSTSGWVEGNGTDDYSFTALPGGISNKMGEFAGVGALTGWWTSTYTEDVGHGYVLWNKKKLFMTEEDMMSGFYARCVQD
jgi:uncharacterized protein (TIGR02145 family)